MMSHRLYFLTEWHKYQKTCTVVILFILHHYLEKKERGTITLNNGTWTKKNYVSTIKTYYFIVIKNCITQLLFRDEIRSWYFFIRIGQKRMEVRLQMTFKNLMKELWDAALHYLSFELLNRLSQLRFLSIMSLSRNFEWGWNINWNLIYYPKRIKCLINKLYY